MKNKILEFINNIEKPFLSEMHFQMELWDFIKRLDDVKDVICEYPFIEESRNKYMDLYVILNSNKRIGVELKYKTQKAEVEWYSKKIILKNQGAEDVTRGLCLLDIVRLEKLIDNNQIDQGIFVILSNTDRIWSSPRSNQINDVPSRFYIDNQPKELTGSILYDKESVMHRQFRNSITLRGSYKFIKNELKNNLFYSFVEIN